MTDKNYIELLKQTVTEHFRNQNIEIFLFGSRAKGDNNFNSDIDIGLKSKENIDPYEKSLLIEKIEKLNLPYKVEIVDFSLVSNEFEKEAVKNTILWKSLN